MNQYDILFLPRHDGKVRIVSASSLPTTPSSSSSSPPSSPRSNTEKDGKQHSENIGLHRFLNLVKKYQHDFYTALKHNNHQKCDDIASNMIYILLQKYSPPSKLYARSYYSGTLSSPRCNTSPAAAAATSAGGREWIGLGDGEEAKDIICRAFRTMIFSRRPSSRNNKSDVGSYIPQSFSSEKHKCMSALSFESSRMERAEDEEKKSEYAEKEDGTDTAAQVLLHLKHHLHQANNKKAETTSHKNEEETNKQQVMVESRNDSFEYKTNKAHTNTAVTINNSPTRRRNHKSQEESRTDCYYSPATPAISPEGDARYRRQRQRQRQNHHYQNVYYSPPASTQSYWQQQQDHHYISPTQAGEQQQPIYISSSSASFDDNYHHSPHRTSSYARKGDYSNTIACCSSSSWSEDDDENEQQQQHKSMIFRRTSRNAADSSSQQQHNRRRSNSKRHYHSSVGMVSPKRSKTEQDDDECYNSPAPSCTEEEKEGTTTRFYRHEYYHYNDKKKLNNESLLSSPSSPKIKPSEINQYDVLCSIPSSSNTQPHILLSIPTNNPSKYPSKKQHMGNFSFITLINMFSSNFKSSKTNRFDKVKIIHKLISAVKNTEPVAGRFLYWKEEVEIEENKEEEETKEQEEVVGKDHHQDEHRDDSNNDDTCEKDDVDQDTEGKESNEQDGSKIESAEQSSTETNNEKETQKGYWVEMKEEMAWNIIVDTILSSSNDEEKEERCTTNFNKSRKRRRSKHSSPPSSLSPRHNKLVLQQSKRETHLALSSSREDDDDEGAIKEGCIDFRAWVPRNNFPRNRNKKQDDSWEKHNNHSRQYPPPTMTPSSRSLPFSPSSSYDEEEEVHPPHYHSGYRIENDRYNYNYNNQQEQVHHEQQYYHSY